MATGAWLSPSLELLEGAVISCVLASCDGFPGFELCSEVVANGREQFGNTQGGVKLQGASLFSKSRLVPLALTPPRHSTGNGVGCSEGLWKILEK